MFGCYAFPAHVSRQHPDLPVGIDVPTVLDALRADPAGYQVSYAEGGPVLGGDDAGIAAAARAAREADVCVAVLGDRAGLFGHGTSGEGCDAADLRLPGRQEELLDALLDTGTPVVLVLLCGRPYELSRQAGRLAAAVCGFFPGEEGATAVADVLSGRVNPSGRLPVSFPAAGSTQPSTYLTPALGQRSQVTSIDPTPLYPFGHGLSLRAGPLGERDVRAVPREWPTDGTTELAVTLRNDAGRDTVGGGAGVPARPGGRGGPAGAVADRGGPGGPGGGRGSHGGHRPARGPDLLHGPGRPPAGRRRRGGAAGRRLERGHPADDQADAHRPAARGRASGASWFRRSATSRRPDRA